MKSITKWLTTGEMIDRLRLGQEAKSNRHDLHIKKTSQGIEHVNTCDGKYLRMNIPSPETLLWRIQPVQVTLEEAMKALRENQTVYFHPTENEKISVNKNGDMCWFNRFLWVELLEGKWTIEGD